LRILNEYSDVSGIQSRVVGAGWVGHAENSMRSIVLAALGLTAATSSLAAALEPREKIPLPGAKGRTDRAL